MGERTELPTTQPPTTSAPVSLPVVPVVPVGDDEARRRMSRVSPPKPVVDDPKRAKGRTEMTHSCVFDTLNDVSSLSAQQATKRLLEMAAKIVNKM